jgi:hypothetical protein
MLGWPSQPTHYHCFFLSKLFCSYIKWTQETFKAGGHKADLLPLLERCTRELQGMACYQNDIRYLRVWVQYADCLPDPGDVFRFLKENDIGQEHALFYIAHATFLELRGNFSAADNVYQQGINRLAAPQDRLRAKFTEFQHRMARRIQRKAQEQQASSTYAAGGGGGGGDPENPERQSLAVLGGRRSMRTAGLVSAGNKRKAVATPGKDNAPAGGGLDIFIDEEFGGPSVAPTDGGGAGPSSSSSAMEVGGRPSTWNVLPTQEQTRKENTQKATSWGGQRMKQHQAHTAPPAPTLDIPLDPEFAAEEHAARVAAAALDPGQQQASLRQRLDRGGLDEQLSHDPLRLHRAPLPIAPVASKSAPAANPAPKPSREEILACIVKDLVDANGEEMCFEELRAKAWAQRQPAAVPPLSVPRKTTDDEDVEMEVDVGEEEEPSPPSPIPDPVVVAAAVEVKATPFDQPVVMVEEPQKPQLEQEEAQREDDVAAEIDAVAGAAAAAITKHAGASSSLSFDPLASSGDITFATRGAFDAINAAFASRFGGDAPILADECTLGGAGMEPTMTISTKEAFAAINSMFANKVGELVILDFSFLFL